MIAVRDNISPLVTHISSVPTDTNAARGIQRHVRNIQNKFREHKQQYRVFHGQTNKLGTSRFLNFYRNERTRKAFFEIPEFVVLIYLTCRQKSYNNNNNNNNYNNTVIYKIKKRQHNEIHL